MHPNDMNVLNCKVASVGCILWMHWLSENTLTYDGNPADDGKIPFLQKKWLPKGIRPGDEVFTKNKSPQLVCKESWTDNKSTMVQPGNLSNWVSYSGSSLQ